MIKRLEKKDLVLSRELGYSLEGFIDFLMERGLYNEFIDYIVIKENVLFDYLESNNILCIYRMKNDDDNINVFLLNKRGYLFLDVICCNLIELDYYNENNLLLDDRELFNVIEWLGEK